MSEIFIGCSGWFYPHWSGVFYPREIPQKNWFNYYSSFFNTVELNSTFYSFPSVEKARRWYRESPASFRYSVKMNRVVTHIKRLISADNEIERFYESILHLKEKLASVLVQFPPSFKYSEENVERISSAIREDIKVFFEFRHKSWYTTESLDKLRERNISIVTVSVKGLPFLLPEQGDAYLRMHGDVNGYATDYSDDFLENLAKGLAGRRYNDIYIYFNNDYHGYAPKNALTLKKLIKGS
ncbi:MAG: DUF72 domain-containing protein [Thermoplasmatales archaeon]